jgi:hypothetical protein
MVKVALDETGSGTPEPKTARKPVPRRKSRWLLKLTLFGGLLVGAAPSLISVSGVAPKILQKVNPRLAEAASFGQLKLHWWAPVEIRNVKLLDLSPAQANTEDPTAQIEKPVLCTVEQVTTSEPLWRIALNMGRGTGVTLKSPRLLLMTDDSGTNIERTIAEIFGPSTSSSSARFPFRVKIEGGEVQLVSSLSTLARQPLLTSDQAKDVVDNGRIDNEDLDDEASLQIAQEPTRVAVRVSDINGTFSTMDTERWLPAMKLNAKINRSDDETAGNTSGTQKATRVAAGLSDVVGDFPSILLSELAGESASGESRIQVHLNPRADEKGRQTIQVGAAEVDLRLLQPFLSMMGIEASCDGTISGGIDARIAGASLTDGVVGRLLLQGENVRVRQQSWASDEWLKLGNVDASGAVAIADDGILLQDLRIDSAVAHVNGSGELRHDRSGRTSESNQQVEVQGNIDLAAIGSSLRQTLALHEDVTVQNGQLVFKLDASAIRSEASAAVEDAKSTGRGQWTAAVRIESLSATRAGIPLQVDSKTQVDAVGDFEEGTPVLNRARLTAGFGSIDCVPDGQAWKISGLVQPESLWQQLKQFSDLPEPGLRGDVSFSSRVAMDDEVVQLTDVQLNSYDVSVSSLTLAIRPQNPITSMLDGTVHVEGTGAALRTLMAPWHDASWLAERSRVVSDLTASPTKQIEVAIRVTPENLASIPRTGVKSVSGRGQLPISMMNASTSSSSSLSIDEADVRLVMQAKDAGKRFDIESGEIKLPGLLSQIAGTVAVPDGAMLLDLTADTSYDLDVLSRRIFTPESGIALSGQGKDIFKLTSDPSSLSGTALPASAQNPGFKGTGTVQWNSVDAFGLRFGNAALQATLDNQLLRSAPIQCSVNGGELNVTPQYDIATSRLMLGTGSRVQNLQITADVCRSWLGYVSPMLADAAEVQGSVSARVDRFLWDFESPQNSDVSAQLTIHEAQASPGQSLASMLEVISLLRKKDGAAGLSQRSLILPEQTVPVTLRQGNVIHDGLVMDLNGYRLKTSGAVNLSEQIQMTIDLPLEKSTAAATDRSIKVPLRGSISRPQPDVAGLLQSLGTQQIQDKINNEVDQRLNKELNKLFDKF